MMDVLGLRCLQYVYNHGRLTEVQEVQGNGYSMAFNPSFSFANGSSSSLLPLVKNTTQKPLKE